MRGYGRQCHAGWLWLSVSGQGAKLRQVRWVPSLTLYSYWWYHWHLSTALLLASTATWPPSPGVQCCIPLCIPEAFILQAFSTTLKLEVIANRWILNQSVTIDVDDSTLLRFGHGQRMIMGQLALCWNVDICYLYYSFPIGNGMKRKSNIVTATFEVGFCCQLPIHALLIWMGYDEESKITESSNCS